MAGVGSRSHFHAREINFFRPTMIARAPGFQVQLNSLPQILLRGSQSFTLSGDWEIQTASDKPFPITLKDCMDRSHHNQSAATPFFGNYFRRRSADKGSADRARTNASDGSRALAVH
jgi:hypothetical protein